MKSWRLNTQAPAVDNHLNEKTLCRNRTRRVFRIRDAQCVQTWSIESQKHNPNISFAFPCVVSFASVLNPARPPTQSCPPVRHMGTLNRTARPPRSSRPTRSSRPLHGHGAHLFVQLGHVGQTLPGAHVAVLSMLQPRQAPEGSEQREARTSRRAPGPGQVGTEQRDEEKGGGGLSHLVKRKERPFCTSSPFRSLVVERGRVLRRFGLGPLVSTIPLTIPRLTKKVRHGGRFLFTGSSRMNWSDPFCVAGGLGPGNPGTSPLRWRTDGETRSTAPAAGRIEAHAHTLVSNE